MKRENGINEIFGYYIKLKEYTDELNDPRLNELITNFEKKFVPYLTQRRRLRMKIYLKELSEDISREMNLPEESVESAVKSIRSGIDHAVAEQHISSPIKTLEGISMPNLTNEGLLTVVISGSGLDRMNAQQTIRGFEQRIIRDLNKGYEVEVEGLGTYRKPAEAKKLDINSQLEFEPLPHPDIPKITVR